MTSRSPSMARAAAIRRSSSSWSISAYSRGMASARSAPTWRGRCSARFGASRWRHSSEREREREKRGQDHLLATLLAYRTVRDWQYFNLNGHVLYLPCGIVRVVWLSKSSPMSKLGAECVSAPSEIEIDTGCGDGSETRRVRADATGCLDQRSWTPARGSVRRRCASAHHSCCRAGWRRRPHPTPRTCSIVSHSTSILSRCEACRRACVIAAVMPPAATIWLSLMRMPSSRPAR